VLGDPIEVQALIAAYGQDRPEDRPLWLGSVKSNIGHTQAAAGAAGLIKMILALQHQQLPATLHADIPSPHIDWSAGQVQLLTRPLPWPADPARERRAAISSFGISGTNAHVILQEPPARHTPAAPATPKPVPLLAGQDTPAAWLVSGRDADGLAGQAARLAAWAATQDDLDSAAVAWSLAAMRTNLEHRAVVLGADPAELIAGLNAIAQGRPAAEVIRGTGAGGRVVFVFPGQGGQWVGMGRELAAVCPVFAARLDECGQALAPFVDWSLQDVIADGYGLDQGEGSGGAEILQPTLWAVMVSLAAVWEAAGIVPDAVVGHSQGEIAAAVVAGILTLEDGAAVVALRSRALAALAGRGAMASIAEPVGLVQERLAAWHGQVSVAAVNGPSATVVSGEPGAIAELAARCERAGVRAKVLAVDYASHSSQVEQIREQILGALDGITPSSGRIPMVSAMTGQILAGPDAGPQYWYESLRAPVEFAQAVRMLAESEYQAFVEISPHPVLTAAITETLEEVGHQDTAVTGTLRRDDGGPSRLLASLAEVHVRGLAVDWTAVLPSGQRVNLPTYAFQRKRYWPRPGRSAGAAAGLGAVSHPLLDATVELAGGGLVLTGRLSLAAQPWLADHAVAGRVLVPGTAFVELAISAGDQAGCGQLTELTLEAPLVLDGQTAMRIQVTVGDAQENGQRPVAVHGRLLGAAGEGGWTRHASGLVGPAVAGPDPDPAGFAVWPPADAVRADAEGLYAGLAAGGYGYGPAFRGLRAAWVRGSDVFADVELPQDAAADAGAFGIHPALLDAALHAAALAGGGEGGSGVLLPWAWSEVRLHAAGAAALRVRLRRDGDVLSVTATDTAGSPVVTVTSLVVRPVTAAQLVGPATGPDDDLFAVQWVTVPVPAAGDEPGRWAVAGPDLFGVARELAAAGAEVGQYGDAAQAVQAPGGSAPGGPVPAMVVVCAGNGVGEQEAAASARSAVAGTLDVVQQWLAGQAAAGSRLVVLTRGAVAAGPGESVTDLAGAAVQGLIRSVQAEEPGRIALVDLPASGPDGITELLAAAVRSGEPEVAIRDGIVLGRRLARSAARLVPPAGGVPWRLEAGDGTLDGLVLAPHPDTAAPLAAGQVRVAVRAAGLNFHDVVVALGMIDATRDPGAGVLGGEIAGVVLETGPGVAGPVPGDRVMGMAVGGFGPVAIADARTLVTIPSGWSFARAAAMPVVFSTAWYGLVDLAGVRPGQRVLVHAATGGVGMAAVAIARHLGAEVFGTASPGKWDVLAGLGLDQAHIASSRDAGFAYRFGQMDVVLNSLAGDLTDAGLGLLGPGGVFLEMSRTDLRDPADVARDHPGVTYRPFDPGQAGPERLGQMLTEISGLLRDGTLAAPPMRCWDVRQAPEAFRFMSQARHTGKIVLVIPPDAAAPRAAGTVLVTGGTGLLGGLVAGHLARSGRARELVLAGRSGPSAPGVPTLAAALAADGAAVRIAACDTADRTALAALLAAVGSPLTGIVHAAGVLDDGAIASLTADRVDAVMRPKADAAWHLHELTRDHDLDWLVLFSSAAATFGSPGQGNYAAANAFLDGLATTRRSAGLPAVSLAWGLWADASAMTGHLAHGDKARIGRGMAALTADQGLALLDAASGRPEPVLVAVRLDIGGLRAAAQAGNSGIPPLLRALAGNPARRPAALAAATGGGLAGRLAGLTAADRDRVLIDLVRSHAAAVLGHASADAIEPDQAFKDLGFDSLTAVELRNRLGVATGLTLPATLVFDYPAPVVLARYLRAQLLADGDQEAGRDQARDRAQAAADPVAIVGMSCRYPGGADTPEALWELVVSGTDAISGFPADRTWTEPGATKALRGGFVTDAAEFDAGFFRISPREALGMDPQQRLLLEISWEALERAGIEPASLRGSATGVFVGAWSQGYDALLTATRAEGHLPTSGAGSVISGRVSYTFGFEGPAVTVDTACSSSLVALHLACQALRSGECDLALAGGVNVMVTAGAFGFGRELGLAPDGRCKAFGATADGMGLAEGAGILLLERLSDARANGHPVLAVVAGSAVNQDGASNGLTAPNGPSQQRVIRAALASAGITADQVDAVEAHGTGTVLGDPIEAQALLSTYGQHRPEDRPLWLGSVKSNIGHTQAAAGVAGVMKMVLALQNGVLPPTLHAGEPSPHVDWSAGNVGLLAEPVPWPADGERPRRAGISSFGISGTNAHAIIEDPPAPPVPPASQRGAPASGLRSRSLATREDAGQKRPGGERGENCEWGILVSGRTAAGLAAQAAKLADWVTARPHVAPIDVAWSLATTRSVFGHQAVVTGGNRDELLAGLAAVAAGQPAAGVVTGAEGAARHAGKTVFVFPGQGAQWAGMGREFAASSPAFAARLAQCARALGPYVDWSLDDVLAAADGGPDLDRADVGQPALWAVMVSLAAAWQEAGIVPDAVVGHSQGEIAAACVAGILSLDDAAKVVALRGRALSGLRVAGGMISVVMAAAEVRELLIPWAGRLSVAAENGPSATVVSGDLDALTEFEAELSARRVLRWRMPQTDFVAHSTRVEELAGVLTADLAGLRPNAGQIPFFSTVTSRWMTGAELDAGYWYANVRQTVRFHEAIRALTQDGHHAFIEVSPHPVLTTAIAETAEEAGVATALITGTLDRENSGAGRFLTALAQAQVSGIAVDWAAVFGAGQRIDLPTYAFQCQRYWPKLTAVPALAGAGGDGAGTGAEAEFWSAVEGGDLEALSAALAVDDQRRLGDALPALASWRRRTRDRAVTEQWRYRVNWVPVADPGPVTLSGTWLVVTYQPDRQTDKTSAGQELARMCERLLVARGARVVLADVAEDMDRAALAARISAAGPLAAVVSLLALHEAALPAHPVVAGGLAATQTLVQALGDAAVTAPLWMLTRRAVVAEPGEALLSPAQAMVWGLGQVTGVEHADRWGGLIDLPAVLDEQTATRLSAILAGCGEDQVAIRGSGIKARRLTRAPLPHRTGDGWVPRDSVLVTGGTGPIGGHLARWLTTRGAPRVVLASRSGAAAPGVAVLAATLAAQGTRVDVTTCDTARRDELAGLLAWTGPALSAVMHAAGTGQTAALRDTTVPELATALAAKAGGAAHLDELTGDLDLDAFVLFSSAETSFGQAGHGSQAAANAFVEALAEDRRARGQTATVVAWGPWDADGIGAGETGAGQRRGLRPMDPQLAVQALGLALDVREGPVTVADVDWARLATGLTPGRPSPLIAGLPEVEQALASARPMRADDTAGSAAARRRTLRERLARSADAERETLLDGLVRTEVAEVLGYESAAAVETESGFLELGFDSLTIVDFRNRLNEATGLALPASVMSECPTPAALARRLRAELAGSSSQPDRAALTPSHSLSVLYAEAARTGRAAEIMNLIGVLAGLRPAFSGRSDLGDWPGAVPISRGPAMPGLICLSSFFGQSGPHEYARFAAGFRGVRAVSALPAPGFAAGEPLPASVDALVSVQAQSISEAAGDMPFVLVGHSSGGLIAHAVANYLEDNQMAPSAIVLLDTFAPDRKEFSQREYWSGLLGAVMSTSGQWVDDGEDAWLTAMAHYFALDWRCLRPTTIPTLLVRAAEPLGVSAGSDDWESLSWTFSSSVTVIDVPGSHFTMMTDHATATTRAVSEWLVGLETRNDKE
jgi:mycoketide-CoA synthase